MVTVGGNQPTGEPWPAGGVVQTEPAAGQVQGRLGADTMPARPQSGETVRLSAGATASGKAFPLGPVLHFVDPREARGHQGGADTARRLGDSLRKQPGESGESLMARTTQTLRDILQAADLTDSDKSGLLGRALDTLMSAGLSYKQETEALIARATSERDRLDALLATIKP